jgi:hypothetical protein
MKRPILALKPTQFAVGMREVARRLKKFGKLRGKKLDRHLRRHAVPTVVGPGGLEYIVDGHHFVRSCWEAGHSDIYVEQKADHSRMSEPEFWELMRKSDWTHPYDQFGGGPHDPEKLPENIRGMADDPYRSLAWAVRRAGGYEKTALDFAEFKWADFFRAKITLRHGDASFNRAVKSALRLCRSGKGRRLPGFEGKGR